MFFLRVVISLVCSFVYSCIVYRSRMKIQLKKVIFLLLFSLSIPMHESLGTRRQMVLYTFVVKIDDASEDYYVRK